MKLTLAAALSLALAASPAAAQNYSCYSASGQTFCNGTAPRQTFGGSFAQGYLGGLNVASHYAMVNAYREANGLPRCHYGIIGALLSASDGRPMC